MSQMSQTKNVKDWDVMLSYRHARHKAMVSRLATFLEEGTVRCWLDTQRIDQLIRLPNGELRDILRYAAESARILVGFPAEDFLAMVPEGGGIRQMPSWLFWERQFAQEVLWVSGNHLYAFPDESLRFWGLPHLAYFLGLACGKGTALEEFWTKYFADLPETNQVFWNAEKLHELPSQFLPPLLRPDEARARRISVNRYNLPN